MPSIELGESIPPDTAHAVSVSLPTWASNVGYEEGASWVLSRMTTGYPRFFIHKTIAELGRAIATSYGKQDQQAMLFSTPEAAERCLDFMRQRAPDTLAIQLHSVAFELNLSENTSPVLGGLSSTIAAALFPAEAFGLAKQYWQHTGDGISSRRAEFCHDLLRAGILVPSNSKNSILETTLKPSRGPKRYQRTNSVDETAVPDAKVTTTAFNDNKESSRFLEERFGRNLDLTLAAKAKSAIRRRIAGSLISELDLTAETVTEPLVSSVRANNLSESDIYLFPAGMNAIFNAHRALMAARGQLQSVSFGFPYVDTLKILQKFGPGCIFYGNGSSSDLDDLEHRLGKGEHILALFCEFPGNPLLASPDLRRIRELANDFDFAVVVDETIGTFANINVLPFADIVVSSLTKIFSGDSNVMGGSAVLNPGSKYYKLLKTAMETVVEDNYWPEDIIFMERNSRDFLNRVGRVNANAEAICDILRGHPLVKDLLYPKFNSSRDHYERCRLPHGGFGGLLSVVFHQQVSAQAFYDEMDIAKGPSLGTNFTLCSPYTLLAHYGELPWAAQFGVDPDLVRVSVGLEDKDTLSDTFRRALEAADRATSASR
ncbi:Cys/Met metabolism, pyridoxal phosphate-dependent enzyme [Cordyceps militaris CM01]|uniref:cystathionine gamma-synthase n=1 Tax=Cordyceps militaris (strain CM01) TaxID=983644 RepID=G3J3S8_CORMM|nr:Cys/Met metabolism, pyridoxal phosphate-dependent enzyme [Cordyceps militaris CM01]EGX96553.1 Cys/Met metabolism, pyridoxal phosphate-dependent enzyme [Cordyceps militaris CM01]